MVRIAIVGLGEIARSAHLPALQRNGAVELVALADSDAVRRGAAETLAPSAQLVTSLDEVLELPGGVDGVVLATPPWATTSLAIQAARAGVFVLAEKPVATTVEDAGAYDVLSPQERARIQVGLSYRHDPALRELIDLVASGALGDTLVLRAHVYDEARTSDAAHTALIERTLGHGSPVIHEGAHVFDWLRAILGESPELLDAWALRTIPTLAAPNLVGARLSYGRHLALVEFGWFTDSLPDSRLEVFGDTGLAVLSLTDFGLEHRTAAGTRTIDIPGDRVARSFDLQLERFLGLIAGGATEPNLDDGLIALELSERVATRAAGIAEVAA